MAGEDERLVVALEARIRDFEKNFDKAHRTANARFNAIEKRAQTSAANLKNAFAGAGTSISSVFSTLGGAGIIAGGGLAGIVTTLKSAATSVADLAAEAQKAGVSFAAFQELKYATGLARVGVDALTDGLKEMQLRADEFVRTGAGSSEEAFKRLGYTAADLKKKLADPAALFEEIIDKMKGFSKAAQIRIADEIFGGTGGEQFVRLMEQGEGALTRARERARELGLVISDDLAGEARKVAQQFDELAARIEVSLKSGVLEGAKALETYKAEIIGIGVALGAVVTGITLGPLVASLATAAAGAAAAGTQLTRMSVTILAVAAAQRTAALATAGLGTAISLLGGPAGIAIAALVGGIALLALRQDKAKASAEDHKKAMDELDKAISEVKARVPGAEATLKALGDQHIENAKAALADAQAEYEYAKAVAARQKLGGWAGKYGAKAPADNTGEMAAATEAAVKRVEEAQKRLDELQGKMADAPGSSPSARTDSALPGKGQEIIKSSQERVLALEAERNALTMTKQAAAEYLFMQEAEAQARQANITLTPQQKAQLEALAHQYGEVTAAIEKTKEAQEQMNELRGALSGFFSDLRSGLASGKTAAQSFSDAVGNLSEKLLDMLQNKLLMQLFNSLPGFGSMPTLTQSGFTTGWYAQGGLVKAATGGAIRGPGSGTSDSIPAMLSNGEYVVNAKQAKKHGPLLEALNSGRIPHFASGGYVGAASASRGGATSAPKVTVNNYAAADGYEARTQSGGINGERLVVSIVRKATARGELDQAQRLRFGSGPRKNVRG
ncbi:phage tail tape measure protein [Xanthobacter autotrophicus]|uniref:hypothetical protein n=1 Tax=Xanthobacter autotrophicus TaxID=280 RepID=UPI0037296535